MLRSNKRENRFGHFSEVSEPNVQSVMSNNGWSRNVEKLLRNWSAQISINEGEYRKRGSYYKRLYVAFGIYLVIADTGALTTLINVIISTILETPQPCTTTMTPSSSVSTAQKVTNTALLIFVAIMSTFNLIMLGVDKFFDFGGKSEKFFEAAKEHNALSRLIDTTLSLPRADRDVAREVLLSVREQFNHIVDNSPNLPYNDIIHSLDMKIYKNPKEARGNSSSSESELDLPKSPPEAEDIHTLSGSEEYISHPQRCRFETQLQSQKGDARRETKRKSAIMKHMDYQWGRMEGHAEDSGASSGYTTPTPYESPV